MLKRKILILSFLIPLTVFSQEMDQSPPSEVPIGSSGIDLAPEEEVSTPTEAPTDAAVTQPAPEPSASEPAPPAPEQAPADPPAIPAQ